MRILPMTRVCAEEISTWKYEGAYSVYSFARNQEVMEELLSGEYRACLDAEGELLGYYCYGASARIPTVERDVYAEDLLDFGLGLRPERCGKGLGLDFVKAGIDYGSRCFGKQALRLTVADFNQRAIKVYERSGFVRQRTVVHNYSKAVFWIMVRKKGLKRKKKRP